MNLAKYHCPKCDAELEANIFQARRGLKCLHCGTGFIPIKIETRWRHEPDVAMNQKVIFFIFCLLLAVVWYFAPWFIAVSVTLLSLLTFIAYQLVRLNSQK